MKISYDAEVDALSIMFRETTVTTKHLADGAKIVTGRCLEIDQRLERVDQQGINRIRPFAFRPFASLAKSVGKFFRFWELS